jgi:hypothetical protein
VIEKDPVEAAGVVVVVVVDVVVVAFVVVGVVVVDVDVDVLVVVVGGGAVVVEGNCVVVGSATVPERLAILTWFRHNDVNSLAVVFLLL